MGMAKLVVEKRVERGRLACRKLRRTGKVPAVLYGRGQEVIPVSVAMGDLRTVLRFETPIVELELDERRENVLIKDVQYDFLGEEVLHVDFTRVSMDEEVQISVPIEARGRPVGLEEGGVMEQTIKELQVNCFPNNIPTSLSLDVSALKIGDSLHVRDLVLPPGVRTEVSPDLVVFLVDRPREEEVAAVTEEKERLEPELIRPEGREAEPEEEAKSS